MIAHVLGHNATRSKKYSRPFNRLVQIEQADGSGVVVEKCHLVKTDACGQVALISHQ